MYFFQIIIVLTAGKQTTEQGSFTPLSEASKPLLDKGVGIYVVGVGSKENIDINELVQISGRKENVLTSEMFKDLVMLAEDLAKVICGEETLLSKCNDFPSKIQEVFKSVVKLGQET